MQTLIDEDGNSYNVELQIRNIEGKSTLIAIWEGVGEDPYLIDLAKDQINIKLT